MASLSDTQYMSRAVQLARLGLYSAPPNPRVGCVLVADDVILGEGYHVATGGPHAEINALNQVASSQRTLLQRATAYVTLEPCAHHGRTGPCCEALVAAGVRRVVYGCQDPNPQVGGAGIRYMQANGVDVIGPVLEQDCRDLNPGFLHRMAGGLPWVRVKLAMSLDGRTAMASGESQWITGPGARSQVQDLRARSCAVISGHSSVAMDGARLTVRPEQLPPPQPEPLGFDSRHHPKPNGLRQPLRVVLDGQAGLSGTEPLFQESAPILWVSGHRRTAQAKNVEVMSMPGQAGRVKLPTLLQALAARQCNEVLVEAGPTLAGQFVSQGLVDELVVFMAPILMGSDARPLLQLPLAKMAEKHELQIADIRAVGTDWQITARPRHTSRNRGIP